MSQHGVGTFKRGYLKKELGEGTVAVMQSIKDLLDPHGIMSTFFDQTIKLILMTYDSDPGKVSVLLTKLFSAR